MKDNSLYCLGILELGILFLIGTEGFLTNEVQISLSHLKLLISFNFANFIGNEIECGRYLMSSESYGLPVTNLIHYEVSDLKVTFLTPLMKVKEESEKVGLKLNVQKTKIMASGPITSWQMDGETVADFIFLGSKITADGDCSHEIKRRLLLGRKVMSNLDSILKIRDITLSTKVRLVKVMVFPVVMYGCESWTIKKAEH